MSGGFFDYDQHIIQRILFKLEALIERNGQEKVPGEDEFISKEYYKAHPEEAHHDFYSDELIEKFKETVKVLKQGMNLVDVIDKLVSSDITVTEFNKRWHNVTNGFSQYAPPLSWDEIGFYISHPDPTIYKYQTIDADGSVFLWENKPEYSEELGWNNDFGDFGFTVETNIPSNPNECIWERP